MKRSLRPNLRGASESLNEYDCSLAFFATFAKSRKGRRENTSDRKLHHTFERV
jgi:hypothetical protein